MGAKAPIFTEPLHDRTWGRTFFFGLQLTSKNLGSSMIWHPVWIHFEPFWRPFWIHFGRFELNLAPFGRGILALFSPSGRQVTPEPEVAPKYWRFSSNLVPFWAPSGIICVKNSLLFAMKKSLMFRSILGTILGASCEPFWVYISWKNGPEAKQVTLWK